MEEIWKDIQGFEGKYQVSSLGRVKSLSRKRWQGKAFCFIDERILKQNRPIKSKTGELMYPYVTLHDSSKGPARKRTIHRLVAEAFLPNPNNFPCVNHKNECKDDNRVENLEWCSFAYNNAYGTAHTRSQQTRREKGLFKAVVKYDLKGTEIQKYASVAEAAKANNVLKTAISNACVRKTIHCNGFGYRFEGDEYIPRKQTFKNEVLFFQGGKLIFRCDGYEKASEFAGISMGMFQCVCQGKRHSRVLDKYTVIIKSHKDGSEQIVNRRN